MLSVLAASLGVAPLLAATPHVPEPTEQQSTSPDTQVESQEATPAPTSSTWLERGTAAYEKGNLRQARELFLRALAERKSSSKSERAAILFNLGSCSYELQDFEEARAYFVESARLDSAHATDGFIHAAHAALARNDIQSGRALYVEAERALERASKPDLMHRLLEELADALERAEPSTPTGDTSDSEAPPKNLAGSAPSELSTLWLRLRPSGVHGWLGVGLGYDTNAVQGGAADWVGISGSEQQSGSPLALAELNLDWTGHWSPTSAAALGYEGSFLGYFSPSARELSLQTHGLSLAWQRLPSLRTRLELGAASTLALTGIENAGLFSTDIEARAHYEHIIPGQDAASAHKWSVRASLGRQFGLADASYLSGWLANARATIAGLHRVWDWGAWLQGAYMGLGTLESDITAADLVHCAEGSTNPECAILESQQGVYVIPLAYVQPTAGFDLSLRPAARWEFEAGAALQARWYTQDSFARLTNGAGGPGSGGPGGSRSTVAEKRRYDLRPRWYLGVYRALDANSAFTVGLDYWALTSVSNMARETPRPDLTTDMPASNSDYDDRNFVQHQFMVRGDVVF